MKCRRMLKRSVTPAIARGFAPIADANARVLILGSMPGTASLLARRYYAHPCNAFWAIMGDLLAFSPAISYAQRTRRLKRAGIALWDVMACCERKGSLDSSIDNASIVPNDFRAFFATHQRVRHVFFNGVKAWDCFRRRVLPGLGACGLRFARLPSTSPAHASLSLAEKLQAWRALVNALAEN